MSITTIIGPMFSGKTTELIKLIERQRIADKKCVIIKHCIDNRFDNNSSTTDIGIYHITTHSNICYSKCDIIYLTDLTDDTIINDLIEKYQVVGIDEGFFFKDINNFCNELANSGILVIVSTLESSHKQTLFPDIGDLIGSSDRLFKLNAVCMRCKNNDAFFTIRTIESDKEILVGDEDMYQCVCRPCLNHFRSDKNKKLDCE